MSEAAIAVAGIFVGAIVAIAVARYQKARKVLDYTVVANPIVSVHDDARSRGSVTVLFDGDPVPSVHNCLLLFSNNGNVPIMPDDYVERIVVRIPDGHRILDASVLQPSSAQDEKEHGLGDTEVEVPPLLVNPGDYFFVAIVTTYPGEDVSVKCQIVGVVPRRRDFKGRRPAPSRQRNAMLFIALSVALSLVLQGYPYPAKLLPTIPLLLALAVGMVFIDNKNQ